MKQAQYILAIDQGTSSTKTLIFDNDGKVIARASVPLHTNYPDNGFVEQDAADICQNVLASVKQCLQEFASKKFSLNEIAAIGISNQRETFVVWDKHGKPLYPAVVWQCKRSVDICGELTSKGIGEMVQQKTGLVIDPYFSATKLTWLVSNNKTIRQAIAVGEAYFGTIDTWLLYKFTGGKEYSTDYTNASRTLLFNLHTRQWDNDLIHEFGLSGIQLPQIKPSSALYGETNLDGLLPAPVPVTAMIGDSHAAAFGEGCFEPGTAKATLGTGCSVLMNIGDKPVRSQNGMVTTVCWSTEQRIDYALEGVIISCGATIEWLKNELNLFTDSRETEKMANAVTDSAGVYLIPSFSGLGSPHWQMDRRASIHGLSFGTTKNHLVRAALESIPFQIKDVVVAMEKDAGMSLKELMTDGGMTANLFVMQAIADLLNKNVVSIGMPDISAWGAAALAGLKADVYKDLDTIKQVNTNRKHFTPGSNAGIVKDYPGWLKLVTSI